MPLTTHCNLNCQMCTVFSPIASKEFLSLESFYRDLARMAELYGSNGVWFRMVGGEPLLHPQITEMMMLARKFLPHALISITTNGLLTEKMDAGFYEVAKAKDIVMLFSSYPSVKTDEKVYFVRKRGINAFKTVPSFRSRKMPLDLLGNQDGQANFARCGYCCNFLLDGRLARCFSPLTIKQFNSYFKQELKTTPDDSIDIHAHDPEEIKAFLKKPISFCKYCRNSEPQYFDWKQSQKQITEWV